MVVELIGSAISRLVSNGTVRLVIVRAAPVGPGKGAKERRKEMERSEWKTPPKHFHPLRGRMYANTAGQAGPLWCVRWQPAPSDATRWQNVCWQLIKRQQRCGQPERPPEGRTQNG
ncbi:hypothetical protein ZHAS_00015842 [Anopheles sinensis]|uniref:Uncharacterized protein n=1 Tax=Anopheles sinensis TaxID=74873 RepID=A0A084WC28_ANOSI|nr:hypothetical protein ZHAS_00015842 [Anopheles sinensis]